MRKVWLCSLFLLLVSVAGNAKSEYLGVDYIFWCTEEPYYSKQLVPFLKR